MSTRRTAKKHNKNTQGGFVPLRRGIYEHLEKGKMTGKEFMVYTLLLLKADHQTGICYKVSAPMIVKVLQLEETVRTINNWLSSLENKGYIKRLGHRGRVPFYPIIINQYLTSTFLLIDAHNPLLHQAVRDYLKGRSSFTFLLRFLSTISIKEKNKEKDGRKRPPTPTSFTPPTASEVEEYAASIGFPELDASYFCRWYEAADWTLKGGNKMRNWKQAVVTWKKRERADKKQQGQSDVPDFHEPTPEQWKVIRAIWAKEGDVCNAAAI